MRTDVKLGVVVAMVVVLVAGGYYMYRDRAQQPILMGGQAHAGTSGATAPAAVSSHVKPRTKSLTNSGTAGNALTQRGKQRGAVQRLNQPGASGRAAGAGQRSSRSPRQNVARNQDRSPNRAVEAARKAQAKRAQQQRLASRTNGGANRVVSGNRAAGNAQRSGQNAQNRPSADRERGVRSPTLPPVASRSVDRTRRADLRSVGQPVPLTAVARDSVSSAVNAASAAVEKHRVQPGDTLSSLAVQYYGSERHTRMLIRANKQLADPNRLKIGEIVNLPPAPTAGQSRGSSTQSSRRVSKKPSNGARRATAGNGRTYTVRSGDSFYVIAQTQLGDASRWKELYQLNRSVVGADPAALKVGQVLTLPR